MAQTAEETPFAQSGVSSEETDHVSVVRVPDGRLLDDDAIWDNVPGAADQTEHDAVWDTRPGEIKQDYLTERAKHERKQAAKKEEERQRLVRERADDYEIWHEGVELGKRRIAEKEAAHEPALTFRNLAALAAEVDAAGEPQFLFEPVIVDGDYGVLSAEDKAGKTWGGLDAAVSAAAGLAWMGKFPCRRNGPVLVFYGEGSQRKVVRRIRAIAASKGLSREQADSLDIVICCRAPQLSSAEHRQLIRAAVADHRPVLVVLDPLYLAAQGANGADLYAMGELLGHIQRITQESGASLLVSHHWNKTGTGKGHNRSSGVGPGAWGRFLISVGVHSSNTDPETQQTTVHLSWMFKGDEIPDTEVGFVRKVRAEDPTRLSSALVYSIEETQAFAREETDTDPATAGLPPSAKRVLAVLKASPVALGVKAIGDQLAEDGKGLPLKARTIQEALQKLREKNLTVQAPLDLAGTPGWTAQGG